MPRFHATILRRSLCCRDYLRHYMPHELRLIFAIITPPLRYAAAADAPLIHLMPLPPPPRRLWPRRRRRQTLADVAADCRRQDCFAAAAGSLIRH